MKTLFIAIGNGGGNILDDLRKYKIPLNFQFLYIDNCKEDLTQHGISENERIDLNQFDLESLSIIQGCDRVIILCCLGGETGTQYLTELVKSIELCNKSFLCFVTLPFTFEGEERRSKALKTLEKLNSLGITPTVFEIDTIHGDHSFLEMNKEIVDRIKNDNSYSCKINNLNSL